jgi:hypothetical protein
VEVMDLINWPADVRSEAGSLTGRSSYEIAIGVAFASTSFKKKLTFNSIQL